MYLVAAWLAVQVATTVFPILGFPRWVLVAVVVAALAGFPITLITAWAFDLTKEGIEVTDAPDRNVRAPWLRWAMALLVSFVFIGLGFTLWLAVRPGRVVAERTPTIAVFPFAVQGGSSVEYLREGIVNLLATSLNGVGTMRSVDPTTLLNSMTESQRRSVDQSTAARIARDVGATSYIIGEISGTPEQIVLTATQYDLRDPKAGAATAAVRGSPEQILDKIDELAGLLITGQMRGAASRLSRIAALTSQNLDALKFYLQGESEYREARFATAMSFFQRAEQEDSTFALASYRLAVASDWASKFDTARVAAQRALRHSQRLSDHDRQLLTAFNAALRGRSDEAEAAYQKITSEHPDDVEAWYRYGEVLYHYNAIRGRSILESKPMFERALRGAPEQEAMLLHLMELALYQKDFSAFDTLTARIDQTKPAAFRRIAVRDYAAGNDQRRSELDLRLSSGADGDVLAVATGLAQFAGDFPNAERVARYLTQDQRPRHVRATGFMHIAQYYVARGQWQQARQALDQLAAIHRPSGLEFKALYAALPFLRVPEPELRAIRAELQSWDASAELPLAAHPAYLGGHDFVHPILREYLLGLLAVRLDDLQGAREAARRLTQRADSTAQARALAVRLAAGVRAFAASASNQRDTALAILERSPVNSDLDFAANSPFWSGAFERWLRAEMLRFSTRRKDAIGWYASLPEGRNELFLVPMATLGKAATYEQLNDRALAKAEYEKFQRMWVAADPVLQDWVRHARSRVSVP